MATVAEESLVWAAERGIGIARGPEPPAALARAKTRYDEAYRAAGHAGDRRCGSCARLYLAPTDDEARERARPWLFHFFQLFSGLTARRRAHRRGLR